MAPRIMKKAKSKKQISAIPHDLEFMLGEEINSPLDSPLSPTEAEYSFLPASPSEVLENLRLVGLTGNETTSAAQSTLSFNDQRNQHLTSNENYKTRFIPEDIQKGPVPHTVNKKSKSKGKTKQKKSEQLDGRIHYSEGLAQSLTSTVANQNEKSSNFDSSTDLTRQNETNAHSIASDLTDLSAQTNVASETSSNPSKSHKTSSERRKSSPTKRSVSAEPKRQTIGNDREIRLLHNIARHQASTECLIPKLPFARLIRETMEQYCCRNLRITPECLLCLQEAAEIYAVQVMEDAYRCTLHRGKITLTAKDMKLALLLRNDSVMM